MNAITEKIKEAKNAIISFETLPSQIDYVLPYKTEANKAHDFINSLPEKIKVSVVKQIENEVGEYYSETGAAQYDCLF